MIVVFGFWFYCFRRADPQAKQQSQEKGPAQCDNLSGREEVSDF